MESRVYVLLQAVKGKANAIFSYPENTNHVLKYKDKPRNQLGPADSLDYLDYNSEVCALDPDALKAILDWFVSQL
jgi:hypothetical protein